MPWITKNLWLIPLLPFLAAGITALLKQSFRKTSAGIVIFAIFGSLLLSLCALSHLLNGQIPGKVAYQNFSWFAFGTTDLKLGFLIDPLSGFMLIVVSFISLLIFIFSVGYMKEDKNFARFFCFLSLFAGSMLMLVIANSLLLLFIAWELVGLSSFLLIGFWFHKPSAVAAMKKAFITTRIGDVGFFIGLVWLYKETGTSLFYDAGNGVLETSKLATLGIIGGGSIALYISLLIFCGAAGKSGQFPLHVWLPDAMEGPTPVSALIHAATMVAAGVFLVGRMYPIFLLNPVALQVVALIGAFTALFAATIALAQWDIKRILAYSTVSQLGFMMMGLGVGGYVAGLFHLFTHAFFKALLFLGAGSIINAAHHEQDIRKMGGLKDKMPWTLVTYCIGSLALAGLPPLAGFFSKDEILLAAYNFSSPQLPLGLSKIPFYFGMAGTFLTAFYMTRQIKYVFFGKPRSEGAEHAHESSWWMVVPLIILAIISVIAGFFNFPGNNAFSHFLTLENQHLGAHFDFDWNIALISIFTVFLSIGLAFKLYHGSILESGNMDPIEKNFPTFFQILNHKYYIDELYEKTFIALTHLVSKVIDLFDRWVLHGIAAFAGILVYGLSLINQTIDDFCINRGFDKSCSTLRVSATINRWIQNGLMQHYLKIATFGILILFVLTLFLK